MSTVPFQFDLNQYNQNTPTHTHIHPHPHTHTHTHPHPYTHTHTLTYSHTHTNTHPHTHTNTHTNTHPHTPTYPSSHTHTHTPTHPYTYTQIQQAIVCGYFCNAARYHPSGEYRTLRDQQPLSMHPTSVLAAQNPPPKIVVFSEVCMCSACVLCLVSYHVFCVQ